MALRQKGQLIESGLCRMLSNFSNFKIQYVPLSTTNLMVFTHYPWLDNGLPKISRILLPVNICEYRTYLFSEYLIVIISSLC